MQTSKRALGVRLLTLVALFGIAGAPAFAEELHFKVLSNYDDTVKIEFNSMDRSRAWPGGNSSYAITPGKRAGVNISCNAGEHICYGAWVEANPKINWGVGKRNAHKCSACCYYCDGGTPQITLNP